MSNSAPQQILKVNNLTVDYKGKRRRLFRAVSGVGFTVDAGKTVGLVGESGSGKTTIARAVQGLVSPSEGSIEYLGQPRRVMTTRDRRGLAAIVQTVFQDPFGSLNPARSIGAILEEPLLVQEPQLTRLEVRDRVAAELERVGLPTGSAQRRPREFSGGQRQRIAIARALIARPPLVICDEAVSALDLSIQAQILNLLSDLQKERGVSYLFITHDLAVVQHIADQIIVLQQGQVVDTFDANDQQPETWSPYTRRLFDAAPVPDPVRQRAKREEFERLAASRPVESEIDTASSSIDPLAADPDVYDPNVL